MKILFSSFAVLAILASTLVGFLWQSSLFLQRFATDTLLSLWLVIAITLAVLLQGLSQEKIRSFIGPLAILFSWWMIAGTILMFAAVLHAGNIRDSQFLESIGIMLGTASIVWSWAFPIAIWLKTRSSS